MLEQDKFQTRRMLYAAVLCCLAGLAGCGSSGRETIEVQGTVTLDGQALADAAVMFSGPEGASPATARTDAQGRFTIQAVPGSNSAAVSKTQTPGNAAVGEDGLMPATGAVAAPVSLVPKRYADFRTSGLTVEVAGGMAAVELKLSSD